MLIVIGMLGNSILSKFGFITYNSLKVHFEKAWLRNRYSSRTFTFQSVSNIFQIELYNENRSLTFGWNPKMLSKKEKYKGI